MRFTKHDALATVFVAAAVVLYLLWVTDTAMTGISVRVLGALVLGLGFAACASAGTQIGDAAGTRGGPRLPTAYLAAVSVLGFVALAAGVATLIAGNSAMLATLVIATVALWVLATVRHAIARETASGTRGPGEQVQQPPNVAART